MSGRIFGSLEELRPALDRALAAAEQPGVCPPDPWRDRFLAALASARTGILAEEAVEAAMLQARRALETGSVHAMNSLVSVANAAAARQFASLVDPGKARGPLKGQRGDINLTQAWLAAWTAEDAAAAAIAAAGRNADSDSRQTVEHGR